MRKEERIEVLKQYDATMTAYGERLTDDGVQNAMRYASYAIRAGQ
ncbi:hypothetical protein PI124_g13561 [Phytophthora idaei]|nr:hypothetical protein PI124_g13561 [Phytophthora idaei]